MKKVNGVIYLRTEVVYPIYKHSATSGKLYQQIELRMDWNYRKKGLP